MSIVEKVLQKNHIRTHTKEKPPGGALNFFQVGVCGPDFRRVGLANWHLPLKRGACERKFSKIGGLWAENFQIWGLVSWKFPNLGACELKFGWKLRLLRLKFPNFLKRGSCELTLLHEMEPLRAAGEAWKGGLQGRTSPYPLSRPVPPPGRNHSSVSIARCAFHGRIDGLKDNIRTHTKEKPYHCVFSHFVSST